MIGQGKLIGLALIVLGAAVAFIPILWAFSNPDLESGGRTLVGGCSAFLGLIMAAAGVYFFVSGRTETAQYAEATQERAVLNAVAARGEVNIGQLAAEMHVTGDQIRQYVSSLVGKGLFTGYIDWKGGRLVSADAASIRSTNMTAGGKCPNCGGDLSLAGKGLIKCPYCGTEFFLDPSAGGGKPAATAS